MVTCQARAGRTGAGTAIGEFPLRCHAHSNVAWTAGNQPGRAASHAGSGDRPSSTAAASASASIVSGNAQPNRLVTGADARNRRPLDDRTSAVANQRQTSATPNADHVLSRS